MLFKINVTSVERICFEYLGKNTSWKETVCILYNNLSNLMKYLSIVISTKKYFRIKIKKMLEGIKLSSVTNYLMSRMFFSNGHWIWILMTRTPADRFGTHHNYKNYPNQTIWKKELIVAVRFTMHVLLYLDRDIPLLLNIPIPLLS